jgi:hypothetical protein
MITAGVRMLSLIMVCLVAGCHQARLAVTPPANPVLPPESTGPNIVAFSLRAAERILTQPEPQGAEVANLAGITRPLGLVYDPDAQDLVIFGQVGNGDPILLDDLVVMMRTVIELGTWPLCSIDQTPETAFTGMQTVRFEGIESTSLGTDCFLADTILKSLALGDITAEDLDIPSYFDMLLEGIQEDGYRASISSRLWGYPMQPSLIMRENTFAIRDLQIGVQAEAVHDPTSQMPTLRDEIAEDFAQQLTQNYDLLSSAYPELGRMAVMFRLAALAHGMRSLHDSPDLRYWLDEYDVPVVMTATEYPALRRAETLDVGEETLTVQVEGGIGMDDGTLRLEDGDLSVLREAVLRSRPDQGTLTWRIALHSAWFEGDAALDESEASTGESRRRASVDGGTYLTRRVEVVSRPAPVRSQSVGANAQVNREQWLIPNQQPPVRVEQAPFQQPRVQQPQVPQPQIQQPRVYQPQVPQPQVQRPQVPQPQIQQPRVQQPQVQQPRVQQPQVQQPHVQQPHVQQPHVQQPQVQQPQVRSAPVQQAPAQQSPAQQPRAQQSGGQRSQQSEAQQSGGQRSEGRQSEGRQSGGRNPRGR